MQPQDTQIFRGQVEKEILPEEAREEQSEVDGYCGGAQLWDTVSLAQGVWLVKATQ